MLNANEQSRVKQMVSQIEDRISQEIKKANNPEQAIALVSFLHTNIDKVTHLSNISGPKSECHADCSHCCHVRVEVTDVEALDIVSHLVKLPTDKRLALQKKLQANAVARNSSTEPKNKLPCAFLDSGLCSIYPIRPSVCRKGHSLSEKSCESGATKIPQNFNLLMQCEALITGFNKAFKRNELPAGNYELSAAVIAALEDTKALENWYKRKSSPTTQTTVKNNEGI